MNRRLVERTVLSLVCTLALVLIPLSSSWAQSSTTSPAPEAQGQVDRAPAGPDQDVNRDPAAGQDSNLDRNSANQESGHGQDDAINKTESNREIPTSQQNAVQPQDQDNNQNRDVNQNRDLNQNRELQNSDINQTRGIGQDPAVAPQSRGTLGAQDSSTSAAPNQTAGSQEELPATAGELPLLGLFGLLSLVSAAGTRRLARARR